MTSRAIEPDEQIGDPLSPFLLTDEAARFLRFGTAHLFRKWAARNHLPVLRRGRTLLYQRSVLTAFLEGKPWTVRRRAQVIAEQGVRRHDQRF